jgi:hypothetical protein
MSVLWKWWRGTIIIDRNKLQEAIGNRNKVSMMMMMMIQIFRIKLSSCSSPFLFYLFKIHRQNTHKKSGETWQIVTKRLISTYASTPDRKEGTRNKEVSYHLTRPEPDNLPFTLLNVYRNPLLNVRPITKLLRHQQPSTLLSLLESRDSRKYRQLKAGRITILLQHNRQQKTINTIHKTLLQLR